MIKNFASLVSVSALALSLVSAPAAAQTKAPPAVREVAPGVTEVDGGRVRVDTVDLATLEATITRTSSLAAVERMIGHAEVASPAGNGILVHMYRITDTATNAPKLLLVFAQGDRIVDHLVTDREP